MVASTAVWARMRAISAMRNLARRKRLAAGQAWKLGRRDLATRLQGDSMLLENDADALEQGVPLVVL